VLINFFSIPAWGANGAAIATISAEAIVFAYMLVRFRSVVGPPSLEWQRVARGLAACVPLAVVLIAIPSSVNVFVRVAVGVVVYLAAAAALRTVSRDELRTLIRREASA
jgi:O-antigen/teichoic acid export membrane protein